MGCASCISVLINPLAYVLPLSVSYWYLHATLRQWQMHWKVKSNCRSYHDPHILIVLSGANAHGNMSWRMETCPLIKFVNFICIIVIWLICRRVYVTFQFGNYLIKSFPYLIVQSNTVLLLTHNSFFYITIIRHDVCIGIVSRPLQLRHSSKVDTDLVCFKVPDHRSPTEEFGGRCIYFNS